MEQRSLFAPNVKIEVLNRYLYTMAYLDLNFGGAGESVNC